MLNAPFSFYIKQLGGTELLVGVTAGGFALAALLMRPLAGWIIDNRSRSSLLIWGTWSLMLISLLHLFIPILSLVIILRMISGFSFSAVHTASNTNACDSIPKSRFGEGMGFLGLGNSLASALGPALGLVIIARSGFPLLFAVSIAALIGVVLIARGLSFIKVKRNASLSGSPKTGFSTLFNVNALPASVVMLFASIPYSGISAFIALYGEFSGLGSGGFFFMLVALGTGITRLFSGQISDRKGEQSMIVIGNASNLLALLLLLLENSACYYISGLFFGIGFGISVPAMQSMAMRIVPMEKRGSASSTFLSSIDIGYGLGGLTAGWLITILGYRPMFAIMIIFAIISLLIYTLWASKKPSAFKNYIKADY